MSRFVEEDDADSTPAPPISDAAVTEATYNSSCDSDSDPNERPTLQQQLYRARQKARKENRRRAEAANPTLSLRGRAKEFYGALEEARRLKRDRQRDEMERELGDFKRVKREKSAIVNGTASDSDNDSENSAASLGSQKEDPADGTTETDQQKERKNNNLGLVNYSDSDSD